MQHPDCLQELRHGNLIHAQKTLDPLNLPQKFDGAMPSSRDVPLELYLASPNGQQKLGGATRHSLVRDGFKRHLKPDTHRFHGKDILVSPRFSLGPMH